MSDQETDGHYAGGRRHSMYLVNHVFFPPQLPGEDDHAASLELHLLKTLFASLDTFLGYAGPNQQAAVKLARDMVLQMSEVISSNGELDADRLSRVLVDMCHSTEKLVALNISKHNSGVIIRREKKLVYVEAFELSVQNRHVMESPGRLCRQFPDVAVAIPMEKLKDAGFRSNLVDNLSTLSQKFAPGTCPQVKKAGELTDEDRDTVDPTWVTEFLMTGVLGPDSVPATHPAVWKNVRDCILWNNSRMPWRRSGTWLLARVSLQLVLSRESPAADELYKSFMLFFAASILDGTPASRLSSDHIAIMIAKIARRKHKLLKKCAQVDEKLLGYAEESMASANDELERRQKRLFSQHAGNHHTKALESLEFAKDVAHMFPGVDAFIKSIKSRTQSSHAAVFSQSSHPEEFEPDILPSLSTAKQPYSAFTLAAFEKWVAEHLDSWIATHARTLQTCARLDQLMIDYEILATSQYEKNPEGASVLMLTSLELWIACDKSATALEPLLREYDPHVPAQLLQQLLLPARGQMRRLAQAEAYLAERARAANNLPNIFQSFGTPGSFAVRFYAKSPDLQTLHRQITKDAQAARDKKRVELATKQVQYASLQSSHDRRTHDTKQFWSRRSRQYYSNCHNCQKCALKSQMEALKIEVHEWPLPQDSRKAEATVFELSSPPHFQCWRKATARLVLDVLGCRYHENATEKYCFLEDYQALRQYRRTQLTSPRISLASSTKPNAVTHRKARHVWGLLPEEVCMRNGMSYAYYDESGLQFVEQVLPIEDEKSRCMYSLPAQSGWLKKYLFRPSTMPEGRPPNLAIANQHETPDSMSQNEFKSLVSVGLGHRIQWQNILCELAMPSIDFRKDETTFVLFQAMYQAGPRTEADPVLREGQLVLCDADFCRRLVHELHEAAGRIKQNWESCRALANFIFIATRALTLSLDPEARKACLRFLREARLVAFAWLGLIRADARSATDDRFRLELLHKAADIALICIATFDIDEPDLHTLLAGRDDASILMQCYINCQECLTAKDQGARGTFKALMTLRWKRVCHRACPSLRSLLTSECGENALDDAVVNSWSDYSNGSQWRPLPRPLEHWLTTTTAPIHGRSLDVKFNLLTGELLVNGLPLSQLPANYEHHAVYKQIFGDAILEVMPTNVPGMQFGIKAAISGYTISLGLAGKDLIMNVVDGDTKLTYQLIPARLFNNLLPSSLTSDHTHWYNTAIGSVEFRPLKSTWSQPSPEDGWTLHKSRGASWELRRGSHLLVARSSRTEQAVSAVISPIEDVEHLHICLDTSATSQNRLDVDLPRLRLQFSLAPKSSKLRSRQFRGTWIAPAPQSIGSLVGLKSKLVLVGSDRSRMLLIPDGQVEWDRASQAADDPEGSRHVAVSVQKGTSSACRAYQVDRQLGRLVDDGSLRSKVYLAYLHAITSFPVPDPLTAHTGTEQALHILRSAAVRSLFRPSASDLDVLALIGGLAPRREFYPRNLKVMEQVTWTRDLGFLSQHPGLRASVKTLLEQADLQEELYNPEPGSSRGGNVKRLPKTDESLHDCDAARSSWCRTPGFGAEDHTTARDRTHAGRGRNWNPARADACFAASGAILAGRPLLSSSVPFGSLQNVLWQCLLPAGMIEGPRQPLPLASRTAFDFSWLYDTKIVLKHICRLHLILSDRTAASRYTVMSWISSMVFEAHSHAPSPSRHSLPRLVLQALEAFFLVPEMAKIQPPNADRFDTREGHQFQRPIILSIIDEAAHEFSQCPESRLARLPYEGDDDLNLRRGRAYRETLQTIGAEIASGYGAQWPCAEPEMPRTTWYTHVDVDQIHTEVQSKFAVWHANHVLYDYLGKIARVLSRQSAAPQAAAPRSHPTVGRGQAASVKGYMPADELLGSREPPPTMGPTPSLDLPPRAPSEKGPKTTHRVKGLVERIKEHAGCDFEQRYAKDLKRSARALRKLPESSPFSSEDLEQARQPLEEYLTACREYRDDLYRLLETAIGSRSVPLPRICPAFFLSQLATCRWKSIPDRWKPALLSYGIASHDLQRAQRLLASLGSPSDYAKELANQGHTSWNPADNPAALLMEIESNLTIRRVQVDIARDMIDPPDGRNSVLQLNMGEGKSTVIVPMVAAALANGERLVRVIVAKAQAPQMRQMLLSKLGGLLDVKIHHLPFSRALQLGHSHVGSIARDLEACRKQGGVLLVQPEHLLSFKLMGLECLINGSTSVGQELVRTQRLLDDVSRDIVDESDENFSVKFELVYTMGMQMPIDFSPDRWHLLLKILGLVKKVAPALAVKMPKSFEMDDSHGDGSFPRLRVFGQDAVDALVHAVAAKACEIGLPALSVARQSASARAALFVYITKPDLAPGEIATVENAGPGGLWSNSTQRPLLLLRGLLAGGVLGFVFSQKRWRVNYGFDANRDPPTRLAVPYRAKDCPSARSEFSHPEVVMLLTALSAYYGGLSDEDLHLTFTHLLKSDQPEQEYDAWVLDAERLDPSFHHLEGVNIEDRVRCRQKVFPALRFAKAAVDFFLTRVVYPKFIKEFPSKLSASGWDLGEETRHPTTGFSGTNDSRELLPLSVHHLDLAEQKHTNSLVLEYLLQDENSVTDIPPRTSSLVTDAAQLLDLVVSMDPEVQVILDVGAQILELENHEVARQWLKMESERNPHRGKKACVYIDDQDEKQVVDHTGHTEPLLTSPYYRQLDLCLVFLDEAHTRGIDLKLPHNYRAALTLGANLTKDRLTQAAMRMRQLGKGQSVTFCIPQEIRTKILQLVGKESIEVGDVLEWSIKETFVDIERSIPLWAVQGKRFAHQKSIYAQADLITDALAPSLLEDEAQTIDDLYRPGDRAAKPCCADADQHPGVDSIAAHCAKFGSVSLASATLHEEQERELSPEIEEERHVEKPKPAQPAAHKIDLPFKRFVATGKLPAAGLDASFPPAFQTLASTSAAAALGRNLGEFPTGLRCTLDFATTVQAPGLGPSAQNQLDQYQRAVRWVLTSAPGHIVVISPFEAQWLLASDGACQQVILHLYAPRSTMGFAPLDDLLLHARPAPPPGWSWPLELTAQLNVFAGQLFFSSHDEYKATCDMLGLDWKGGQGDGVLVQADGFIAPSSRSKECRFTQSPVPFLKILMTKIRRDCESIDKTHVGRMLDGLVLEENDF